MEKKTQVSFRTKTAYGLGAIPDMLGFHGPVSLVGPVYTLFLGLSPWFVALAIAITRIWDACLDPVMGGISDRTQTPWGRRRPFIFAGAVLCGITFAGIGWAPLDLGKWGTFFYLLFSLMAFYTAFTVFTVPYHALGYEITDDYHQRTGVMSYRLFFNTIGGMLAGWLLGLASLDLFKDTLQGARLVCLLGGCIFLIAGCISGLMVKESKRPPGITVTPSILVSIKTVIGTKPFLILLLLAFGILCTGTMIISSFLIYINTFYVFGGDLEKAATLQGVLGVTIGLTGMASIPLSGWLSKKIDKKGVMYIAFSVQLLVGITAWWAVTPRLPYFQVVPLSLHSAAIIAYFLMMHSMVGDICDLNEYRHGNRLEGMYGAAITWIQKMAVAGALIFSGGVLSLVGFDPDHGTMQSDDVVTRMRLVFCTSLVVQPGLSLIALKFYPLSSRLIQKIQTELKDRRQSMNVSN